MRISALAAAVALIATSASAQVVTDEAVGRAPPVRAAQVALITTTDANGLIAALQRAGFTGEASTQGRQASVIGRIGTLPFQAFLGNCDPSGGGCTEIELYAGFTGAGRITLERINGWNNRTRFARASLDPDGSPSLQMDLSLQGGVSPEGLKSQLETWGAVLQTYAAFLTSSPDGAARPAAPAAPAAQPRPPRR
ncbi:MAG: YbjN domain-containing protein [Hyphomonadaceae bacterium]|nr:YbjN domain-containing protein [Hyphomonadaceae bacterium]